MTTDTDLRAALERLDAPLQWLHEHYPKAFIEMPTPLFRRFKEAEKALAAPAADEKCLLCAAEAEMGHPWECACLYRDAHGGQWAGARPTGHCRKPAADALDVVSPARLYDALWLLKDSRLGDDAEFPTLPEVRTALAAAALGESSREPGEEG